MGLFSSFFKKSDPPSKSWSDDVLGSTAWSDDEEEWQGVYKGRRFGIAYAHTSEPSEDVVEFAREVLNDPEWLDATLRDEKARASASAHT